MIYSIRVPVSSCNRDADKRVPHDELPHEEHMWKGSHTDLDYWCPGVDTGVRITSHVEFTYDPNCWCSDKVRRDKMAGVAIKRTIEYVTKLLDEMAETMMEFDSWGTPKELSAVGVESFKNALVEEMKVAGVNA